MKIGLFKRLSREDLGGAADIPDWIDALLNALNMNLEPINIAMTGKISFGDNFFSTLSTQIFTHNKQLVVNPQKGNARPIGIIPINALSGFAVDSYSMTVQANGSVGITMKFLDKNGTAVATGTQVTCTVLILFG